MPMGGFLDSIPSALYIGAHVIFLLVGLWAMRTAKANKAKYASAFWLYVLSQVVFLMFFGDIITMKMAVLLDQTLMVIMVIWIAKQK
jgi:low temperature requirement protein LtrA